MGAQNNTVSVSTLVGVGNSSVQLRVGPPGDPEHHQLRTYRLEFYRERPGTWLDTAREEHQICRITQKCSLPFMPGVCGPVRVSVPTRIAEQAGRLSSKPLCTPGEDQSGHWVLPCRSCHREETCDWSRAQWTADSCRYRSWTQAELQRAGQRAQLLFLGDSTLRSVLYRVAELLNGSLTRADSCHELLQLHVGSGAGAQLTFSYHPRFFVPQHRRPSFKQLLLELFDRARPVGERGRTRLVVGGVQWLSLSHLDVLQTVLKEQRLSHITVIIKGHGAGFHLPGVDGSAQSRYADLYRRNQALQRAAESRNWTFVDTLAMTLSRLDEFTQGGCACHFHTVERLSPSQFSIQGPVNEAYTRVFLHHLFSN